MKHLLGCLLSVILFAVPSYAQHKPSVASRVIHYAGRHKMTIASAAILTGIGVGEVKSTRYAERVCPTCQDQGFFGSHPTYNQLIAGQFIIVGSMTTVNLLADKYHPDKGGNVFLHFLTTLPLTIGGIADIKDNYGVPNTANGQQAARKRLMR